MKSDRESGLPRRYLMASLALLAGTAAYFRLRHGTPVVDDAYIAFIYARNLAHGAGLTYIDQVRVEGYTDFLWVLVVAAGIKAGIRPDLTAGWVSAASGVALVALVWRLSQLEPRTPAGLRVAAPLLAVLGPVAFWTMAGLETVSFTLLVLAGGVLACGSGTGASGRRIAWSGFAFFLAALAHPDAIVLFVPVLGWVAMEGGRAGFRQARVLALSFGLPFLLYWIWRWAYFADFFPNTFHAKDSHSLASLRHGVRYAAGVASVFGPIALGLIAAALPLGLLSRQRNRLFLWMLIAWLTYVAWIGGDTLLMRRFLVPVLPPLALLLEDSLGLLCTAALAGRGWRLGPGLLASAAVVATAATSLLDPEAANVRPDGRLDASRIEAGKWLAAHSRADDLIAVAAAGATPYFANRPTLDMLGLNDRHIAHRGGTDPTGPAGHQRYDAGYVLGRRPAFVFMNSMVEEGRSLPPERSLLPAFRSLLGQDAFARGYTRVRLAGLKDHEVVFLRNDRYADLRTRGLVASVEPTQEAEVGAGEPRRERRDSVRDSVP